MRENNPVKKGVVILGGASDWQIFQQDSGYGAISIYGTCHRVRQEFELPMEFKEITDGAVTVKARIAFENSGESVIPWTECLVKDDAEWSITFEKVPAGGPYRIETYMEYEGWDGLSSTRGDMIHFIGVGDIYVVAGQSNAAGRAKNTVEDGPEIGISVLRPKGKWELASHPLGETTDAVHVGHFENHNPGHTPWLHFAKMLYRELGYPIGIVMSAYGGAPLRWWNPAENGALTENMLDQLLDYDIKPKGVLWYQGEAEGYENAAGDYKERFLNFVSEVRSRLSLHELPFITVQINRCMNPSNEELDRQWGMVREAQVAAADCDENIHIIPSTDVSLYDFIHNSAEGNLVIGERAARCALSEIYGRKTEWKAPRVCKAKQISGDSLEVFFDRVYNWINPYDVDASLLPFEAEDEKGLIKCIYYETKRDSIVMRFERELGQNASLHGMWRMNPGPCVPWDCMRLPMLSFYGFSVEK